MNTLPAQQQQPAKPTVREWIAETFWVMDVIVLGMFGFFIVVGGAGLSNTPLTVALVVLAALYAVHAYRRRRHHDEVELSPSRRANRERRGF